MYKLCQTEQSAQRQRELEKMLAALMKVKRYEDISVSDFCAYAAIPRKAFYRYFSSKDGALYALIDHTIMGYESTMPFQRPEDGKELMQRLESFFVFWKGQQPMLDALAASDLTGVLLERGVRHMEQASLVRRLLPGETEGSQKQIVRFVMSGLLIMMINWHREGFRESTRELAELTARILNNNLVCYVSDLL